MSSRDNLLVLAVLCLVANAALAFALAWMSAPFTALALIRLAPRLGR